MTQDSHPAQPTPTRRSLLKLLAGIGVGTPAFQRALAFQAEQGHQVTIETVKEATESCPGVVATIATAVRRDARGRVELRDAACPAF
jgi:hypothetical protein